MECYETKTRANDLTCTLDSRLAFLGLSLFDMFSLNEPALSLSFLTSLQAVLAGSSRLLIKMVVLISLHRPGTLLSTWLARLWAPVKHQLLKLEWPQRHLSSFYWLPVRSSISFFHEWPTSILQMLARSARKRAAIPTD